MDVLYQAFIIRVHDVFWCIFFSLILLLCGSIIELATTQFYCAQNLYMLPIKIHCTFLYLNTCCFIFFFILFSLLSSCFLQTGWACWEELLQLCSDEKVMGLPNQITWFLVKTTGDEKMRIKFWKKKVYSDICFVG